MSRYRFIGTLREVVLNGGKVALKFIPDAECSSVHKESKKKKNVVQKFVILQPVSACVGKVYAYESSITFEVECKGGVCLTVGLHCEMILDDDRSAVRNVIVRLGKSNGSKIGDSYCLTDIKVR